MSGTIPKGLLNCQWFWKDCQCFEINDSYQFYVKITNAPLILYWYYVILNCYECSVVSVRKVLVRSRSWNAWTWWLVGGRPLADYIISKQFFRHLLAALPRSPHLQTQLQAVPVLSIFSVPFSYFIFIFYLPLCTLPDFASVSSLASLQFLPCFRRTNNL